MKFASKVTSKGNEVVTCYLSMHRVGLNEIWCVALMSYYYSLEITSHKKSGDHFDNPIL